LGAPRLLIDAAQSYGRDGENRRTELFATTLDEHPRFCVALVSRLKLPEAARYVIDTQRWVSKETRVDLTLDGFGNDGARIFTIYSEHKVEGYWFSDGQVDRERRALDHEPSGAKRLICIIPASAAAELQATTEPRSPVAPSDAFDDVLSWEDVVDLADNAGRGYGEPWGGPGWTERALAADAPACQRILAEFLFYLQGEEKMSSLTADEIQAFQLADQADQKIGELMLLTSSKAGRYRAIPDDKGEILGTDEADSDVELAFVDFEPPQDAWLSRFEDDALSFAVAASALSVNVRRDAHHRGINDLEGENGERRTCWRRARMELELRLRLLPPAAKTSET
jgi:hypothetical protein